jgi:hypothetical protein
MPTSWGCAGRKVTAKFGDADIAGLWLDEQFVSPRVSEIRENVAGTTMILRFISSWLYFRAFVAHFEAT